MFSGILLPTVRLQMEILFDRYRNVLNWKYFCCFEINNEWTIKWNNYWLVFLWKKNVNYHMSVSKHLQRFEALTITSKSNHWHHLFFTDGVAKKKKKYPIWLMKSRNLSFFSILKANLRKEATWLSCETHGRTSAHI